MNILDYGTKIAPCTSRVAIFCHREDHWIRLLTENNDLGLSDTQTIEENGGIFFIFCRPDSFDYHNQKNCFGGDLLLDLVVEKNLLGIADTSIITKSFPQWMTEILKKDKPDLQAPSPPYKELALHKGGVEREQCLSWAITNRDGHWCQKAYLESPQCLICTDQDNSTDNHRQCLYIHPEHGIMLSCETQNKTVQKFPRSEFTDEMVTLLELKPQLIARAVTPLIREKNAEYEVGKITTSNDHIRAMINRPSGSKCLSCVIRDWNGKDVTWDQHQNELVINLKSGNSVLDCSQCLIDERHSRRQELIPKPLDSKIMAAFNGMTVNFQFNTIIQQYNNVEDSMDVDSVDWHNDNLDVFAFDLEAKHLLIKSFRGYEDDIALFAHHIIKDTWRYYRSPEKGRQEDWYTRNGFFYEKNIVGENIRGILNKQVYPIFEYCLNWYRNNLEASDCSKKVNILKQLEKTTKLNSKKEAIYNLLKTHSQGQKPTFIPLEFVPDYLIYQNGYLKLSTLQFITEPDVNIHNTFTLPYDYQPLTPELQIMCDKAFTDIYSDPDIALYVKKLVAQCFTPNVDDNHIYFHWGESASNGKSTFWTSLVLDSLGEYGIATDSNVLTISKSGDAPCPFLIETKHKYFLFLDEMDKGKKINNQKLKTLAGGMTHQRKCHSNKIEHITMTASIHIACNEKPDVDNVDNGTNRRIVVIPCTTEFTDSPSQPHHRLKRPLNEILSEYQKIIPVLALYCFKFQHPKEIRITMPDVIRHHSNDYIEELNPYNLLLNEYFEPLNGDDVCSSRLWLTNIAQTLSGRPRNNTCQDILTLVKKALLKNNYTILTAARCQYEDVNGVVRLNSRKNVVPGIQRKL